jgi:hypothetical protein
MHRVWRDAVVPVEFHGPPLNLDNIGKNGYVGHLLKCLSPLVLVVLAFTFIVVSYASASPTLLVREIPIVIPPKYYIAVGHFMNMTYFRITSKGEVKDGIGSFLYSNFPGFGDILYPIYNGSVMGASFTSARYLDIRMTFPPLLGVMELRHLNLIFPISIQFPRLGRRMSHCLLQLQAGSEVNFTTAAFSGRVVITQRRLFQEEETFGRSSMEAYLASNFKLNQTHAFTLENLERAFEDNAFGISVVQSAPKLAMVNDANTLNVTITLRIPELFVETPAPFWNMLKVTYVQFFYWFLLVSFVWMTFVEMGFRYGVISAAMRFPLRAEKLHAD